MLRAQNRISAKKFIAGIEAELAENPGERIERENCAIRGQIDLSGRVFAGGLWLYDVEFDGRVELNNCRFNETVTLTSCKFQQGIELSHSRIESGLKIQSCTFGSAPTAERPVLVLEGASVDGNVQLVDSNLTGRLSAIRMRLRGDLSFAGCNVSAKSGEAGAVDLTNSRILGNVNFEAPAARALVPPGKLFPRSCFRNEGDKGAAVVLRQVEATDISLGNAHFFGAVNLSGSTCATLSSGIGEFVSAEDDSQQRKFSGAKIEGTLQLINGKFGFILLRGIHVSAEFFMVDGSSGAVLVEDGVKRVGNTFDVVPSRIGNFYLVGWHCRGVFRFHPREVLGPDTEWWIRGVYIRSCRLEHHLSFWPGQELAREIRQYCSMQGAQKAKVLVAGLDGDLQRVDGNDELTAMLSRWGSRLKVQGAVKIEHCKIGGDVLFTGIAVNDESEESAGRIEFRHCKVEGHVCFGSPVSFLGDSREDDRAQRAIAGYFVISRWMRADPDKKGQAFEPMSSCNSADLQWVSARSLDLSGLRIHKARKDSGEAAHINLRYSNIRGLLCTFARLEERMAHATWSNIERIFSKPPEDELRLLVEASFGKEAGAFTCGEVPPTPVEAAADIGGALNLEHAEIDELRLSDSSFRDPSPEAKASDAGIVLDYAKVNKLYVGRGERRKLTHRTHNGFPVPISLLDVAVSTWFLEGADRATIPHGYIDRETTEAEPYLDLLDNDPNFRMSSYLQIEKSLRDRGLESEAKQIYIAGHHRDLRQRDHRAEREPAQNANLIRRRLSQAQGHAPGWTWLTWRPGDGRYRDWSLKLGLVRPQREYLASLLGFVWSALFIVSSVAVVKQAPHIAGWWWVPWLIPLALLCVLFFLLRTPMRLFFDQLYWIVLEYGTNAFRLFVVIVALFFASLIFVSDDAANFEPTLRLQTAEAVQRVEHQYAGRSGKPESKFVTPNAQPAQVGSGETAAPSTLDGGAPVEARWGFGERLWVTLHYHVPLVAELMSEDWQTADRPLRLRGTEIPWMRARDWFGMMMWLNWLLWPLFLPYIIRRVTRDR